jgi:hypothetical protein
MAHLAGNCLWLMFERQGDDGYLCEPDLFFHRFRPYISSWVGVFEGQDESSEVQTLRSQLATLEALGGADSTLPDLSLHKQHIAAQIAMLQRQAGRRLCGPSGAMSGILPLCDAFLQIEMSSAELAAMLTTFAEYMPHEHCEVVREAQRRPVRLPHPRHSRAASPRPTQEPRGAPTPPPGAAPRDLAARAESRAGRGARPSVQCSDTPRARLSVASPQLHRAVPAVGLKMRWPGLAWGSVP